MAKQSRRQARRARGGQGTGSDIFGGACPAPPQTGTGAKKKGASPQQYVDRLSGEPARRQARRHRACEVERHWHDLGAKKTSIVDVAFSLGGCSRSLRESCGLTTHFSPICTKRSIACRI